MDIAYMDPRPLAVALHSLTCENVMFVDGGEAGK